MKSDHAYFVYILASRKNGTLYIGITNDLLRRVAQHREGLVPGFTDKYAVKLLVYYEVHTDINEAIAREKRIKRWLRRWKLDLIEKQNSQWNDLWPDLAACTPLLHSCHPGRAYRETRDPEFLGAQVWVPALRFALAGMTIERKKKAGIWSRPFQICE